jgi:hypothetical protein
MYLKYSYDTNENLIKRFSLNDKIKAVENIIRLFSNTSKVYLKFKWNILSNTKNTFIKALSNKSSHYISDVISVHCKERYYIYSHSDNYLSKLFCHW